MVTIEKARLQSPFKDAAVMGAVLREHKDCVGIDHLQTDAGGLQLRNDTLRKGDGIVERMGDLSDHRMGAFGHYPEPRSLSLVSCESEELRPSQYGKLHAVVMSDVEATDTWRNHAVGGDDGPVVAIESDDNGHPRKTLLTFISG